MVRVDRTSPCNGVPGPQRLGLPRPRGRRGPWRRRRRPAPLPDRRQIEPNGPAAAGRGDTIEHQPGRRRHVASLGGGNHRIDHVLTGYHPLGNAGGAVPGAELHAGRFAAIAWGESPALCSACIIRISSHIRMLADRRTASRHSIDRVHRQGRRYPKHPRHPRWQILGILPRGGGLPCPPRR
jgi:hypothetical protein